MLSGQRMMKMTLCGPRSGSPWKGQLLTQRGPKKKHAKYTRTATPFPQKKSHGSRTTEEEPPPINRDGEGKGKGKVGPGAARAAFRKKKRGVWVVAIAVAVSVAFLTQPPFCHVVCYLVTW